MRALNNIRMMLKALWRVLRLYKLSPKLIALLEDLRTGTTAAVRLEVESGSGTVEGSLGPAFEGTARPGTHEA